MSEIVTGTSNQPTLYFENGEQVYPCRCGETHRGDYAYYDYWHHNCYHTSQPLLVLEADVETEDGKQDYLWCVDCGQTFWLARP